MQKDFHWKTATTEPSKVSIKAITKIHTKVLRIRSFLKERSFR